MMGTSRQISERVADFCSWAELIGHFRKKQRTGAVAVLTDFGWKMSFSLEHLMGAHSYIAPG